MTALLPKALQDAICTNQPDLIESNLTKEPVTMAVRLKELDTCLEQAMPAGSLSVIERLLALGARLIFRSLSAAVARQEPEIFQLLVDYGWDINSTRLSLAAIHVAVNYTESLRWLLEHGADPDIKSERQNIGSCLQRATPLDYAAQRTDAAAVQLLLSHGAKLDPDAMYHAIGMRLQKNGPATMQALIDYGADVNHNSKKWCTPLYHAVRRGQLEKVKLLLERGANPELRSSRRHLSALELAKLNDRTDMCGLMEAALKQVRPL